MRRLAMAATATVLGLTFLSSPTALATSAPDEGAVFAPHPASAAAFSDDGAPPTPENRTRLVVETEPGVEILVETWLPRPKPGGAAVPATVPTVVWPSPYNVEGVDNAPVTRPVFNRHGYAVSFVHLRGTGGSGGCFDLSGPKDVHDLEQVVEAIAHAPWSDGTLGMYGISWEADAIVAFATKGTGHAMEHLKAIIPVDANGGQYDVVAWDGVARGPGIATGYTSYFATAHPYAVSEQTHPGHVPQRPACRTEQLGAGLDADVRTNGSKSAFWTDREWRLGAHRVTAPTLLTHGLASGERDTGDWFSRLPAALPKHMMVGWWEHTYPNRGTGAEYDRVVHPDWARADWFDAAVSWLDQHVRGLDAGTDGWPAAQVQDSTGQWRAIAGWPDAGGPSAALALGPGGTLGGDRTTGSTTYTEALAPSAEGERAGATFLTPALTAPLHVTGQPSLDLHVRLSTDDAHVAARLEALDAAGRPIPWLFSVGTRSAQHLDPLVRDTFVQAEPKPAVPGATLRIPVRFDPVDWVVPAGGRLRLVVSGTVRSDGDPAAPPDPVADPIGAVVAAPVSAYAAAAGYTMTSGRGTTVEILHGCRTPSVLRFQLPARGDKLLNVREQDEVGQTLIATPPHPSPRHDGGGIAALRPCGS